MSPILDRQRRLTEIGRIRMGAVVATQSGKTRPSAIDKWRLTSRVKDRLDAAARLYGGTVKPWEGHAGEWELFTESDTLDVILAPDPVSLWYELWSGGGCKRRCDGETEQITDSPCLCLGEAERQCKETTRVKVFLPNIPGFGIWRIESHGYNASVELAGQAEYLADQYPNTMLKLRIDPRTSVRDGQTKNFVVPVLDLAVTMLELAGGEAPRGYTPIQAAPAAALTPARALEQVNEPKPARKSARAAAPIGPPAPEPTKAPIPVETEAEAAETPREHAPVPSGFQISDAQRRRLFAIAKEKACPEYEIKRLCREITGDESTKSIASHEQYEALCTAIEAWEPLFEIVEGEVQE